MKKSILFCTFIFLIYSNTYAQRIVKSAIDQYSNYRNSLYYNNLYEYVFDRTFELSDGSIVTISTNQYNFFITKWNKDLVIQNKTEIEQTKKQAIYYSCMLNNKIYLFSYDIEKDDKRVYNYYEITCTDTLLVSLKNNAVNKRVVSNDTQYIYMLDDEETAIYKVNMQTLQSGKIPIPTQSNSAKESVCYVAKNYIILLFPSGAGVKSFVLELVTGKINQIPTNTIIDQTNMEKLEVAVNKDSIYFIRNSNIEDHLVLNYEIMGYDFSSNTVFLEKKSSLKFPKEYYHRDLATLFFDVDSTTGNLMMVLDRYHEVLNPTAGMKSSNTQVLSMYIPIGSGGGVFYSLKRQTCKIVHIDYPVFYFNSNGDVLNTEYIYWPKVEMTDRLTESFFPNIIRADGLLYCFISNPNMDGMTCFVYNNSDGKLKDKIVLFENDKSDKKMVSSSTIYRLKNGSFVFATIPASIGKTGNYYMFNVYK